MEFFASLTLEYKQILPSALLTIKFILHVTHYLNFGIQQLEDIMYLILETP
jgi:hypothetical protein